MANPRTVAVRRQIADQRLERAARAASAAFGVPFKSATTPATRDAALAATETTENVAEFLERITAATTAAQPQQRRAS